MIKNHDEARYWYLENTKKINKMAKLTNQYGLGFMQYCILVIISNNNYETPSKLADEMDIAVSSVSRSLKTLNGKGLVTRLSSEFDDTRRIKIEVTLKGEKLLKKIDQEIDSKAPEYFE